MTTQTSVGSGTDTLVLRLYQDFYQANAQYTVKLDGTQLGGTFSASAGPGDTSDTLTIKGDWAPGAHTLEVAFLNDLWGGSAGQDRNLFVNGITYDGAQVTGWNGFYDTGQKYFGITDTTALPPVTTPVTTTPVTTTPTTPTNPTPPPAATPASTTLGSGPDTLVLKLSQDAYNGNAQYTVSVDGVQQGGTYSASALHGSGQDDTLTVQGNWAPGGHSVVVNFLNDAYGGSAATDRNLYVDGMSYNGAAVAGGTAALMSAGPATLAFTDASAALPAALSYGSGPDTLVLKLSQDSYNGNAQYTVSVDGVQQGGTYSASALHGNGQDDTLTVQGNWAAGNHSVVVNFLNDAYGGSAGTDRNLYVDGITYDGASVSGGSAALLSAGPASFAFTDGSAPAAGASVTLGSGAQSIVIRLNQDAFQGASQYVVKVDGQQVGGVTSATSLHSSGADDTVTVKGDWSAGAHSVTISFLNDLWGGDLAHDRNLYVDSVAYNGQTISSGPWGLYSSGDVSYNFVNGSGSTGGTAKGIGGLPPSGPATTVAGYAAHISYDDEFNSLSSSYSHTYPWGNNARSNIGNGETEYYSDSSVGVNPFSVANGVLTITAAPHAGLPSGLTYTSGMINTVNTFTQEYGYFEIRASSEGGLGMWPAFWLAKPDGTWPPELDVMEVIGRDPTHAYLTVHSEAGGYYSMPNSGQIPLDWTNGFHSYGVSWRPDALTFYFDGNKVWSTPTPGDFHQPLYMIANLAVATDGTWAGGNTGETSHMNIDYIRAYQYDDLL